MGVSLIFVLTLTTSLMTGAMGHAIEKRNAPGSGPGAFDYPDYPAPVKYDEYPVVVPKRAALLLDRLMVALQKAVDDQSGGGSGGRNLIRSAPQQQLVNSQIVPVASDEQTMDLQRRGQAKGRVYWRCYFNAVTCFKRK